MVNFNTTELAEIITKKYSNALKEQQNYIDRSGQFTTTFVV